MSSAPASPEDKYLYVMPTGKVQVRIRQNGVRYHVGTFDDKAAAREARDCALAAQQAPTVKGDDWEATGVLAFSPPDEQAAYQRAVNEYRATAQVEIQKASQRLRFAASLVCMVFVCDLHFGDAGTDVQRAFDEAQLIDDMPNTYCADLGDKLNQFIMDWAMSIRLDSRQSIGDEWALLKLYLKRIAPKLRISVGGNHDAWIKRLSGVDWFREVFGQLAPDVIYDAYDNRVVIEVAGVEFPIRLRHSWRGHSIYNLTHGIERAARFDDKDFVLGVGAHTHASGVARGFNVGSQDCLAVLCGSYKRLDAYQREKGLPHANDSTAVAVIFDAETQSMIGCNNLEMAAKIMNRLSHT